MEAHRSTGGQAAVETALMFIFVIIGLLVLILDGGPLILDWMMAKELSARGARAAAIYTPDDTGRTCLSDVENALGAQTMPFAEWSFIASENCDDSDTTVLAPGTDVTVTIVVDYRIPFAVNLGTRPPGEPARVNFGVSTTDQAR
jgi:Flp pilus assembly protein TadG